MITGWRVWHPRHGYRRSGSWASWGARGHLFASKDQATQSARCSADAKADGAVVLPVVCLDPTYADLDTAIARLGDHPLAGVLQVLLEHQPAALGAVLHHG